MTYYLNEQVLKVGNSDSQNYYFYCFALLVFYLQILVIVNNFLLLMEDILIQSNYVNLKFEKDEPFELIDLLNFEH